MISYTEIIAVVAFMAVAVIIIIWLVVKKAGEKRTEERKARKLRGEEEEEKEKQSEWFKNKKGGGVLLSAITPLLVYIAILVSFSILLPDLWQKYWGRQEFFWISIAFLITIAMVGKSKGFWLKFIPTVIFGLILFLYVKGEWPKPDENGNDSNIVAETDATAHGSTNVRTVKIVAHPDKWVKVQIPCGRDWQFDSNPAYGLENTKTLVAVRINGDERTIKRSGMLQDGSMSNAFFEKQASYVEFKSEDKNSAYLLVHLTKK